MSGRPTSYKSEFCDIVLECLKDGGSILQFAAKVGVARSSVYNWIDENPDFAAAVKTAQAASAKWWEDRLTDLAQDKDAGNASAVIFGVKNRARREWRDDARMEHTGADGAPLKVEVVQWMVVNGGAGSTDDQDGDGE